MKLRQLIFHKWIESWERVGMSQFYLYVMMMSRDSPNENNVLKLLLQNNVDDKSNNNKNRSESLQFYLNRSWQSMIVLRIMKWTN